MKKILTMAILALGIFFINFAQVSAQEIYCYTLTRDDGKTHDTYAITETIQKTYFDGEEGFKVRLHDVGRNYSYSDYWEIGFYYVPVRRSWSVVRNYTTAPLSKDTFATKIFNVCKPYI